MKISLIQLDIALGDPEKNTSRVQQMLTSLDGSDLVVLPELWSTGYALREARRLASSRQGGSIAQMRAWASEFNVHVAGSVLEEDGGSIYNTLVLASPDGRTASYRKLHLFRLMDEHTYLSAGEEPTLAETPWGSIGLSVCYDLRFPLLYQAYAEAGARMILVVAEWPAVREDHWVTLVRARAIETQSFMIACNRSGSDLATRFAGKSMIVDPWGETLAMAGDGEAIVSREIDPSSVEAVRAKIPVTTDRKDRSAYQLRSMISRDC